MGRYRELHLVNWTDDKFCDLTQQKPSGQSLWIYLLIGPLTTNVPGVLPVGIQELASRLRWSSRAVRRHLDEILTRKMARADLRAPLIWVPKSIRYRPPQNPNIVKSWSTVLSELPACELRSAVIVELAEALQEIGPKWFQAFTKIVPPWFDGNRFGNGFGNRIGNQEQEQEQDSGAGAGAAGQALPVGYSGRHGAGEPPPTSPPDPTRPDGAATTGAGEILRDDRSRQRARLYLVHLRHRVHDPEFAAEAAVLDAALDAVRPVGLYADSDGPVLEAPPGARDVLKAHPAFKRVVILQAPEVPR